MAKLGKKFEEFHAGEHEFCRKSGPLKSRKISAPSAVIKALVTSVATAATVYIAVFAPLFSFVSSLQQVDGNAATIEVNIENTPEDSIVTYTLSLKNQSDVIVTGGEIGDGNHLIVLDELKYDEEYLVTFVLHQEDGDEVLRVIEFLSGKQETSVGPQSTSTPEPAIIPTPTSTPEPTTTPLPTSTPEPTTIPLPMPTPEPTTIPLPTPTPEPEVPIVDIQVKEVLVNRSEAKINLNEIQGYAVEETHVFVNVPTNEYTIQIVQNGEINAYTNVYDEDAKTATITYMGNPIALGETATSKVVLTYGESTTTSENTITVPKLTELSLDVEYNDDGTYTYRVNGQGIEPSAGHVKMNAILYTDFTEHSSVSDALTFTADETSFLKEYTVSVNAPGKTLKALVQAELVWSLDPEESSQKVETATEYYVNDVSEIIFTDIHEEGSGYMYTVQAKFANLASVQPQQMTFYRQSYNPVFHETEPEEQITILDASQISFDAHGNVVAEYTVTEEQVVGREANGHTWRIVLNYLDLSNTSQTREIIGHVEPFSPTFNHLNSIMWQHEGVTYVDYEMVFSISETYSHKGADLLNFNAYNWDVLSAELELTDAHGYIRGRMTSTAQYELSFSAYLDWYGTEESDFIYTGCGGASYLESSLTHRNGVLNSEGTGYESVVEEFTLYNGIDLLDIYTETYVLVTLADGTQIKVNQSQPDASGIVSVNWNDSGNIVVTVNQSNVVLGQRTVVDFVQETVREEEMMLGLVNSFIYRCFSEY